MADRIYLDTTVFISALVGPPDPDCDGARAVLAGAQAGDFQLVLSSLVMAETVGAPKIRAAQNVGRPACKAKQAKARAYIDGLNGLYIELSEDDGQRAAELSREYDLGGADALHLAAALRHRCVTLFTSDNGFLKVNGLVPDIQVLRPDWGRLQLDYGSGQAV